MCCENEARLFHRSQFFTIATAALSTESMRANALVAFSSRPGKPHPRLVREYPVSPKGREKRVRFSQPAWL